MSSFEKNIKNLKQDFLKEKNQEKRYFAIINLGKSLPSFPKDKKNSENKVIGCQSITYLYSYIKNKKIYFKADSDSLISKGLAAILISLYEGLEPKEILKNPSTFLEDIKISETISIKRANGFDKMYEHIKKDIFKYIKN